MRDAIMLALHREATDAEGQKSKKLNIIAAKLVDLASEGDIQAIKEINDRVDGKVPQGVIGGEEDDPPIVAKVIREIVRPGAAASNG